MLELVVPSQLHLASYKAALEKGWSPDNIRLEEAAREELAEIEEDPVTFLDGLSPALHPTGWPVIPETRLIKMPDGQIVPRLPGFRRWLWDGGFCGSIGFRWQPGTALLPDYCLGHIGYAVVPWKQRRGHATAGLAILLGVVRGYQNLPYVEITTETDNLASQKVILANHGVLAGSFHPPAMYGHQEKLRYRIPLNFATSLP